MNNDNDHLTDTNIGSEDFLSIRDIRKKFHIGSGIVEVLKDVSFQVQEGRWVALLGASGSGKTTLLDIIGTISKPDSGEILIAGTNPAKLHAGELVTFRRHNIGFVFQSYHMLPELTILENVMLPSMLDNHRIATVQAKASELLERVGLSHRLGHRPNELSGGEQQRAAIARSLMNEPRLLLADEPTGNLDSVTGAGILDLFKEIRREGKTTIVMVTHDHSVAALADSTIELRDGSIHS